MAENRYIEDNVRRSSDMPISGGGMWVDYRKSLMDQLGHLSSIKSLTLEGGVNVERTNNLRKVFLNERTKKIPAEIENKDELYFRTISYDKSGLIYVEYISKSGKILDTHRLIT